MIGEVIGHYRVLELVGRGSMGLVYKALDENLDRPVALKVMSVEARNDPAFVERFRQEARMQGALNHPNIALLFDYFIHDGAPVAVMEFVEGETLGQLVRRRGPIPAHECVAIFKQALRGVAAAHRAGIIHRDLKSTNLMLTKDDIVKVMDFGIAKRQGSAEATKASTSIGSPLYMAPEQILGRTVDCRTDVYALGVTFYHLLCGQPPFNPRGKTEYILLNAHVNDLPEPPTVHCGHIPQPIVEVVMRALAKEPTARFQSADEFMYALPDVGAPSTVAARSDPSYAPALEYTAPMVGGPVAKRQPSGTVPFEYAPSALLEPRNSLAFDYSSQTLRQHLLRSELSSQMTPAPTVATNVGSSETPFAALLGDHSTSSLLAPAPAVQRLRAAWPGLTQRPRTPHPAVVTLLVAAFLVGAMSFRYSEPKRFTHKHPSTATRTPTSSASAAPAPAAVPTAVTEASPTPSSAGALHAMGVRLARTTAIARFDISGAWRGEYLDASGKQLLRVVNLSIRRVHDDGGIEGKLQYEAASGGGECKLDPRSSIYLAGTRRLQLSPESCSPHYPKELEVPLDFAGVNPRGNTLKDGRIEAPTGMIVRVRLRRVSG